MTCYILHIVTLKQQIKIEEYRTRMMFIYENIDIFYLRKMISMQLGEEPWTTISKWVVTNEGFPAQDSLFRTFCLQLLSLNDADRAKEYNYLTECANRYEWYKRWLFEEHCIIKSKLNENSAKESPATVSITHSDSNKVSNTCQPASQPLIPQLPRKSPINMSDVIRPKRKAFDE